MDATAERECSALGCLFQQIIQDMKNGAPLWEDLISKATKLHTCLKAAILAISAYLEAFQKIADAATNARGATREIGTALTRICLRHKAVETRVKSFTSVIMDCLILPLQEKLEDWKKSLVYLDKEHAREYKKARTELKKKSSDTLRLQKKKARKGLQQQQIYGTLPLNVGQSNAPNVTSDDELGRLLESSAAIVQEKRQTLEDTERKAVRAALLEERGRFCQFARVLKPVLDEEMAMLMELTHLQEVAEQLEKHATSPQQLPPASEQLIMDIKGRDAAQWALAQTPPSSPSLSLGSRKSSVCSISSLTSSSSGSCKSHPSPGHPAAGHPSWHRSNSQQQPGTVTLLQYRRSAVNSGSRDSGFTSLQETCSLYAQPTCRRQMSCTLLPQPEKNSRSSCGTSAWSELRQETDAAAPLDPKDSISESERPHTISAAYERGHQRPALSVHTFQTPVQNSLCKSSQPASPVSAAQQQQNAAKLQQQQQQRKNSSGSIGRERPPIPNRCSSLERPSVPARAETEDANNPPPDSPRVGKVAKEVSSQQHQPMYVNMHELANLAASRAQEMLPPPPPPPTDVEVAGASQAAGSKVARASQVSCSAKERRASSQQASKPAPPTRRVSALVPENCDERGTAAAAAAHNDDLDNLPPPPAFLLEGSSPPAALGSPASQRRSISVSETVRTLTELRHTPASPSLLRRKVASTQAHVQAAGGGSGEKVVVARTTSAVVQIACCAIERAGVAIGERHCSTDSRGVSTSAVASKNENVQGPGAVAHNFIATLSAKLTSSVSLGAGGGSSNNTSTSNSPKPTRKNSIDRCHQQQPQQSNRNSKTSHEFLESLNARLAQQQQHHHQQIQQQPQRITGQVNMSLRSASVRRIMANRVPILDPLQVRGSLMDQIRRGTSLRKTKGPINDRSAPKIY